LEDPALFDDMLDAGLMTVSEDGLTIGQVLGRTLIADCEALQSIKAEMVDGAGDASFTAGPAAKSPAKQAKQAPAIPVRQGTDAGNAMIHLEIGEAKGLVLDIPAAVFRTREETPQIPAEPIVEDRVIRTLTKKYFRVNRVQIGDQTAFENGLLTICEAALAKALNANPLVKDLTMEIITPDNRHVHTETIMDICPVATKASGRLGDGVTHVLDGVVFMLTGVDEDGVQVHEFGSSEGYLDEKMAFGRPGCADADDIIVRVHAVIERGAGMERRGPFAAHSAEDVIIQEVRDVLKVTAEPAAREEICRDVRKQGRPKVVLVKEIMGQGAMHDNVLCPAEPAGVHGGQKNVDLGNVPVMMTPNQVRDGAIHALTCIGPATKEMTRHYFREPLAEALANDDELDLVGVVFVGSPQVNDEKMYVSERLGTLVETLDVNGAIVTTEGFGNNHIDFASHIEQIGMRGIPVVGVSFCAYQGQLVVGNPYMDAMIEVNKDESGFENEIAGCSTITEDDAARAILMLKTKMSGFVIEAADHKWNQAVVEQNQKLVREAPAK
jgi:D-proline reductase (dithiol) PrdA